MATAEIQPYDPWEGKLLDVITESDPDDVMPPPPDAPLSQQQINLITTWINQGAQNLTCTNTTCDSTGISFSADIQPLIQSKCLGCHNVSSPGGGILLNNYSNIAAVAQNGKLTGSITYASGYIPMPKNAPKLSDCEIAIVRNWINEGIQNN
jgi:uncharacterized membrane protein